MVVSDVLEPDKRLRSFQLTAEANQRLRAAGRASTAAEA